MSVKTRQVFNEENESIVRVTRETNHLQVSLGVGSHMSTVLTFREALRLSELINQAIREATDEPR